MKDNNLKNRKNSTRTNDGLSSVVRTNRRALIMRPVGLVVLFVMFLTTLFFGLVGLFRTGSPLTDNDVNIAEAAVGSQSPFGNASWENAVKTSSRKDNNPVSVSIGSWTATWTDTSPYVDGDNYNSSYLQQIHRTQFGWQPADTPTEDRAYYDSHAYYFDYSGALNVPSTRYIKMNLSGALDRGLANRPNVNSKGEPANGYTSAHVLHVYGKLDIIGSGGATITGANVASGAALHVASGGDVYVKNVTFKNNIGYAEGSAICVASGGKLILENCIIEENTNHGTHGAVCCASGGELTMINCTVRKNVCDYVTSGYSDYVGGIFTNGTFTMEGGTVTENTGSTGGLAAQAGTLNVSNVSFTKNKTIAYNGISCVGGVYLYGCTPVFENCTISQNEGSIGGMAVNRGTGVLRVDAATLVDYPDGYITAKFIGGTISNNKSTATYEKTDSEGNKTVEYATTTSTWSVGGLMVDSTVCMEFTGTDITNNVGLVGGIFSSGEYDVRPVSRYSVGLMLIDVNVSDNICNREEMTKGFYGATHATAGIYNDGQLAIQDSKIQNNKVTDPFPYFYGTGGICNAGTVTILTDIKPNDGTVISDNEGYGTWTGAGGMSSNGASGTINLYGGTITGNYGFVSGGICKVSGSTMNIHGNPVVKDNYVRGNLVATGDFGNYGQNTQYIKSVTMPEDDDNPIKNDIDLYYGRRIDNSYTYYRFSAAIADRTNVMNVDGNLFVDDDPSQHAVLYVHKYTNNFREDSHAAITSNFSANSGYVHDIADQIFFPSLGSDWFEVDYTNPDNGNVEIGFHSLVDMQNWADANYEAGTANNQRTIKLYHDMVAKEGCFYSMFHNYASGFTANSNNSGTWDNELNRYKYSPSALSTNNYIILDLNGHTIDRGITEANRNEYLAANVKTDKNGSVGYVIYKYENTYFTITDTSESGNGKITGGYNTNVEGTLSGSGLAAGGGVYAVGGTLVLQGGHIAGNYASNGAGIYATSGCTLKLEGGTIEDNVALPNTTTAAKRITTGLGGGIFMNYNCKLYMNEGVGTVIKNNTASLGGGIEVHNADRNYSYSTQTKFVITRGSITNNIATYMGGGINVYWLNTKIEIGGSPTINGNKQTSDDRVANGSEADDIHLPSQDLAYEKTYNCGMLTIISKFELTKKIGVYRDFTYDFTSGFKDYNPNQQPSDCFVAQKKGSYVTVSRDGKEGWLLSSNAAENWYSAVIMSQKMNKKYTVRLTEDWIGVPNSTQKFTTSMRGGAKIDSYTANTNSPYYYGAICVPAESNVELDLNGHTIDRNLRNSGSLYGCVFYVAGGTLTIIDSTQGTDSATNVADGDGVITGGWIENTDNYLWGGGITIDDYRSRVYMKAGTITGNKANCTYSTSSVMGVGGVATRDVSYGRCQFEMTGGTITGNVGTYSGGVSATHLANNTLRFGGDAKVYDNYRGGRKVMTGQEVGIKCDVYSPAATSGTTLAETKNVDLYKLTIVSTFTDTARIGISRPDVNNATLAETNGNIFTKDYSVYNTVEGVVRHPNEVFFPSDPTMCKILEYGGGTGTTISGLEATVWITDAAKNWSDAHAAARALTQKPIEIKLESDWVADAKGRMYNDFITNLSGFDTTNGNLKMTQSNIILDLNGYTIDRGFTGTPKEHGYWLIMDGTCKLEITDSSEEKTGKIIGCNNSTEGEASCIHINKAASQLILTGGLITGNRGDQGAIATFMDTGRTTTNYLGIGGTAMVTGNVDWNDNPSNINLRAKYAQTIDVVSTLTKTDEDQYIGVYRESSSDFTKGFTTANPDESPIAYFRADSPAMYVIAASSGEGALYTTDNYSNWVFVCAESYSTSETRTVSLVSDWDADTDGLFGKSLNEDDWFYQGGALRVKSGVKIVLDLAGYKLNRNITESKYKGFVIYVASGGRLTIIDSSAGKTGQITGGNNYTDSGNYYTEAGGAIVNQGVLYIEGGTITGNYCSGNAGYATGGIFTYSHAAAQTYISGGEIKGNTGTFTGGANVYSAANLYLSGSARIYDNFNNLNTPSDVRACDSDNKDTVKTNKIVCNGEFNNDAKIGVIYVGNNYNSNPAVNVFTSQFNISNPGKKAEDYFFYSDTLKYKIVTRTVSGAAEGAVECIDNEQNWYQAIKASSATVYQTVTLNRDWEAYTDGNYGSAFGTDTDAFRNGGLWVNYNRSIKLNLNGYKIDRKLYDRTSMPNGYVLYLQGNLEISDNETMNGQITGGNSENTAGGIEFITGSLNMKGGSITNNKGNVGGLSINKSDKNELPFSMGGSAVVYDNIDSYNYPSDIVANCSVQMITITSSLTATEKTGFTRQGVGDFTDGFAKKMSLSDPADYFTSHGDMYVYKYDNGEAALYTTDNKLNWQYAISASIKGSKQIVYKLIEDWYAEDERFGKGDDDAFVANNGALRVPSTADIVLDLSGYTLSRNLRSPIDRGYVIQVEGKLTLRDTSDDASGVLTGGYNNYNSSSYMMSSAISCFNNSRFTMLGGTITGNRATGTNSAAIVSEYESAYITILGGKITNNTGGSLTSDSGAGGILLMTSAVRIGRDAYIKDNTHNFGYGCDVRMYSETNYMTVTEAFTSRAWIGIAPNAQINNYAASGNQKGGLRFTTGFSSLHPNTAYDTPDRYFHGVWKQKNVIVYKDTDSGKEAAIWCAENYTNWMYAVEASNSSKPVVFQLTEDWVAEFDSPALHSFYKENNNYYKEGAIYLQSGRWIILDLNGYKIDRGIPSTQPQTNGSVIKIDGTSVLEVIDSSSGRTGMITGGNNAGNGGGGILVSSGSTLALRGGTITNNFAQYGAGVCVMDGGKISLSGNIEIHDNLDNINYENSNVYLDNPSAKITIPAALNSVYIIGVTRKGNGNVTDGFAKYNSGDDPTAYFEGENSNYDGIVGGDGEFFFLSPNNVTNWEYAVKQSIKNQGATQTVKLANHWTADLTADNENTSFGSDTDAFYYGALLVPAKASIELDLAGYTLDRSLSLAKRFGVVIIVRGKLVIKDSSTDGTGVITGGNLSQIDSYVWAAGISIDSGGRCDILGGTVSGNIVATSCGKAASGVYVNSTGRLTLNNANVVDNNGPYGGIIVANSGMMTVGGKVVVENNKSGSVNKDLVFESYTGTMSVESKLLDGTHITVSRVVDNYNVNSEGGSVITTDYSRYNTEPTSTFFFSSDGDNEVVDKRVLGSTNAALFCKNNILNWSNANKASRADQKERTVTLYSDWTAQESNGITDFTNGRTDIDGNAFYNGALRVAYPAQIRLDLNGFNLNRDLSHTYMYGYVILISDSASLIVVDNSGNTIPGYITGGSVAGEDITKINVGAGIHAETNATLRLLGGRVTENTGVGVYLSGNNRFSLGGNAYVNNNTLENGKDQNIYLEKENQLIDIESAFTGNAVFGVSRTKGVGRFASGVLTKNYSKYNKTENPSTYFKYDDDTYIVVDEGFFSNASMEAVILGKDNYTNWSYAIKTSQNNGGKMQTFTLYSNWTAGNNSDYVTSFQSGTVDTGYRNGALFVPSNASVTLDLNGHTLNRDLTAPTPNGSVFYVQGTLKIIDSSEEGSGTITGGYTNSSGWWQYNYAGCINAHDSATVIIEGGTITGNYSEGWGPGAIYVSSNATLQMAGGKITGNHGQSVGGVYVDGNGSVMIKGTAYIYDNLVNVTGNSADDKQSNLYFAGASGQIRVNEFIDPDTAKVGISVNVQQIDAAGRFMTSGWQTFNNDYNVTRVFCTDDITKFTLEDYNKDGKHEAVMYCRDNSVTWAKTVQLSVTTGMPQTFTMHSDWIAKSVGSDKTFYAEGYGTAYYGYAIRVPSGANITLDLNGHTIDHGLSGKTAPGNYGYTFYVDGELTVIDSTAKVEIDGKITQGSIIGAYDGGAGAFYLCSSGKLNLQAGTIRDNKSNNYGAGVYVDGSGCKLTLGGTVQFKDNINNKGERQDLYLYHYFNSSNSFYVGSEMILDSDPSMNDIYVYRNKLGVFTTDWGKYNGTKVETRFKSALAGYRVQSTGAGNLREAAMISDNNVDNWTFAVTTSINNNAPEYFQLIGDGWDAGTYSGGSYDKSFGSGNAYSNGALYVPSGANVVLDLAGKTINRNHNVSLDDRYAGLNAVIIVEGKLQIIDTSDTNAGKITGGSYGILVRGNGNVTFGGIPFATEFPAYETVNKYGTSDAGIITANSLYGVKVESGKFTATGGKITGNVLNDVYVSDNDDAVINVGDDAYIYTESVGGNKKVSLRLANPLGLINIISTLSDDARIAFSRQGVGQLTKGWGEYNGDDKDPYETIFISREPDMYKEITMTYDDHTEASVSSFDNVVNWQFAVDKSLKSKTQQEFILYSCWTAAEDTNYKTAFGTTTAFRNGALYVPEGADIVINLNGHKLDRALQEARDGAANGMVFYVDGKLEIKNEPQDDPTSLTTIPCIKDNEDGSFNSCGKIYGTITGGNNSTGSAGGAICVGKTGELTLTSGAITGNKSVATSAGAGAVYVAGKFTMDGGTISGNRGTNGSGAIYLATGSEFTMAGGIISDNTVSSGAGAIHTAGTTYLNSGSINNNQGTSGAITVAVNGKVDMHDVEITENTGTSAGAVFVNNGGENTYFHMYGGKIANNTAVSAGGIYTAGYVMITGGEITGNTASGTTLNDGGGAIYVAGTGHVEITGGEITNNTAKNGIRVFAAGYLGVGGTAKIYNNITTAEVALNEGNNYVDVHFTATTRQLNIISKFEKDVAVIGIYRENAGIFTRDYGIWNSTTHPNQIFVSNRSIYAISITDTDDIDAAEAAIGIPATDPTVVENVMYDGNWQTIITDIDEDQLNIPTAETYDEIQKGTVRVYEVAGKSVIQAVDADSYMVPFTLKPMYCWSDGTTSVKYITAKIAPKPVTLTWANETHEETTGCVYDGVTDHGKIATVVESCLVSNILTGKPDTCKVEVYEGREVKAGTHTVKALSVDNDNYTIDDTSNAEATYTVEKATIVLSIKENSVIYKSPTALTVEGNLGEGAVTFNILSGTGSVDSDNNIVASSAIGSKIRIEARVAETDNYRSGSVIKELEVVKGKLNTKLAFTEMYYGDDKPLEVVLPEGVTLNEVGDITYQYVKDNELHQDIGEANISNIDGKIYALGVGTVTVVVKIPSSNYFEQSEIRCEVVIKPRPVTIRWEDSEGNNTLETTYNGKPQAPGAYVLENVLSSDISKLSLVIKQFNGAGWENSTEKAEWTNAGEYDIGLLLWLNGRQSKNYTFESEDKQFAVFKINKADPTWTIKDATVTFGVPFTPEIEDLEDGLKPIIKFSSTVQCEVTDDVFIAGETGEVNVTVTTEETENYNKKEIVKKFIISEAQLPMSLDPDSITFGDTGVEIKVFYTIPGSSPVNIANDISLTVPSTYSEYVDITTETRPDGTLKFTADAKKAGKIKLIATTTTEIAGYKGSTVELDFTIKPKEVEATFDDLTNFVYNGTVQAIPEPTLVNAPAGVTVGRVFVRQTDDSGKDIVVPFKDAGDYKLYVELSDSNYALTARLSGSVVTMKQRVVTLSWPTAGSSLEYNGEEQAIMPTVSNACGSDVVNVIKVTGATNAANNLMAIAQELDNDNYTLEGCTTNKALFNITPKKVSITWGNTQLVYNGQVQHPEITVSGLLNDDETEVAVDGAQINVTPRGTVYTATATGLTNFNYVLPDITDEGANLSIDYVIIAADLDPEFKTKTAYYGDQFVLELENNLGGGRVTYSITSGSGIATIGRGNLFTANDIGTVTLKAVIADSDNYNGKTITYDLQILPRPVKLVWYDNEFDYDGENHVPSARVENVINSDEVNVTVSGTQKNAGTYTATATAVDNNKYTVEDGIDVTGEFTIKPRVLEISWQSGEFVYNGNEQYPQPIFGNLVGDEVCNPTVSGSVDAGIGLQAEITELDNENYTIVGADNVTTRFDIKPLLVQIEWSDFELEYTGSERLPTATVSNLIGNDIVDITLSGGQVEVTPENEVYTATAVSLSDPNYTLDFDPEEVAEEDRPVLSHDYRIVKAECNIELTSNEVIFGSTLNLSLKSVPSDATVTYEVDEGGTGSATINGNVLKATGAGEVYLKITVSGSANYNDKTETDIIVTVKKYVVEIEWTYGEYTYNGSEQYPTATVANELAEFPCSVVTVEGSKDAGENLDAKVTALSNENYTLEDGINITTKYSIKPLAVLSLIWGDQDSFEFNGQEQAPTATVTGLVAGDSCEVIISGKQTNVGINYVAKATGLANTNYSLNGISNLEKGFEITIANTQLSIITQSIILSEETEIEVSGNVGNGEMTFEILSGELLDGTPVDGDMMATLAGSKITGLRLGKVTIRVTVGETANSTAAEVEGDISIIKGQAPIKLVRNTVAYGSKLKIELDDDNGRLLDEDTGEFLYGDVSFSIGSLYEKFGSLEYIEGVLYFVPKMVGTAHITAETEDTEYFDQTSVRLDIIITPRTIKLTWDDVTEFTYNGETQYPSVSINNIVQGDEVSLNVEGAVDAGDWTAKVISLKGKDRSKYSIENTLNKDKSFTILPRKVAIDFGDDTLSFNGKDQTPAMEITRPAGEDNSTTLFFGSDKCDVEFKVLNSSNIELTKGNYTNVGSYKLVVTGLTNGNYELDQDYSILYTIERANLNPSFKPAEVEYGTTVKLELVGNYENAAYVLELIKAKSVGLGTLTQLADGSYEFTATRTGNVVIKADIEASENCNAFSGEINLAVVKAERNLELVKNTVIYGDSLTLALKDSGNRNDTANDKSANVKYLISSEYGKIATVSGDVFKAITPNKGKVVGDVKVIVSIPATDNYKEVTGGVVTVTILPKPIEVVWTDTEKIYNGKEQYADCEIKNLENGDVCGITVAGGHVEANTYEDAKVVAVDNPNYTVEGGKNISSHLTIGKQDINVQLLTKRVNIGVPTQLEISGNIGNAYITYEIIEGSSNATLTDEGEFTGTKIGTAVVKIKVYESTNYLGHTITEQIVIGKKTLEISLKKSSVQYDEELTLEVDGNTTTYTPKFTVINDTGTAEIISGNILKATKAGTVRVSVFIPGNGDFDNTTKEFTVNITPRFVTIVWNKKNEFVYNGTDIFVPGYKLQGVLDKDEGNCNLIIEGGQINAGTWNTAYATGLDNGNYTLGKDREDAPEFIIKKAPPSIEFATKAITINVPTIIKLKGTVGDASVTYMLSPVADPSITKIGEAELNNNVLTGTKLGWIYVCATISPSSNYDGISIYGYIEVEKPEAPVDLDVKEITYGETLDIVLKKFADEGGIYSLSIENDTGSAELSGGFGADGVSGYSLKGTKAGDVYVVVNVTETETYKETHKKILVKVLQKVVEIEWGNETFIYNGLEQSPTATVTNKGSDTVNLIISGQIDAGENLIATITGVDNPNYTLEGVDNLTHEFTISPLVVVLNWEYPEFTYNGKVQVPTATVTNLKTRENGDVDVCQVIVDGVKDAGTANTAIAEQLGNSNYTLEGCTNKETTYEIKPYKVTLEVKNTTIPYCGKYVGPEIVAKDAFDGDEVHATFANGSTGIGVGEYTATVNGVDNPNYTCDRGAQYKYNIVKAKIEFEELTLEKEYNGQDQDPTVVAKKYATTDILEFTFTYLTTSHRDAGEYKVKINLKNTGSVNNYYLADEDKEKTLNITPKKITLLVTTKDINKDYTGSNISISDWYTLSTEDLVSADGGKSVSDLFDLSQITLIPEFEKGGVTADSVGAKGAYSILLKDNDYGDFASKNGNYVANFVFDETNVGTLTISGDLALRFTANSNYKFIYNDVQIMFEIIRMDNRRSYDEMGWVHGKDDLHLNKVVIGNVKEKTSVESFLNNIHASQVDKIRLYDSFGDLVWDYGQPADGYDESDMTNYRMLAVGTGWKVVFGEDEEAADVAYVSVLGDLNGDGYVQAGDVSVLGSYLRGDEMLEDEEFRLAGLISNSGDITITDIAIIGDKLQGYDDVADYFN